MDAHLPIFIYGTLRPGQKNHDRFLAGRARKEIPATISGELHVFLDPGGARYPFLVPGSETVHGDLVYLKESVRKETLAELDCLEGYHPETDTGLYLRRKRSVRIAEGEVETVTAWVYLWNGPRTKTEKIRSGDFEDWRQEHSSGA